MSLYTDFVKTANERPKAIAAYYNQKPYTYIDLLHKIDKLSIFLANDMHLHETVTVSLCLKNSIISLCLIYALNKIGVIVNLINPNLASDQILFFDSIINSRILFIDKKLYLETFKTFKNIMGKIALVESDKTSFKDKIKFIYNHKKFKGGIPFNNKGKSKSENKLEGNDIDNNIALCGPNEKFDDTPFIVTATNKGLAKAYQYQKEIYQDLDKDLAFIDASLMSVPLFISYFHTNLCLGNPIILDDTSTNIRFKWVLKHYKIKAFLGDISSYRSLFGIDAKLANKGLKTLKSAYIYNDSERSYVLKHWNTLCQNLFIHPKFYSLLGSAETLGAFLKGEINDDAGVCFGEFIKGYTGLINTSKKKLGVGRLYVKSDAKALGYYKNVKKTDEIINQDQGIYTEFEGSINLDHKFYLSSSRFNVTPYFHNSPYLVNLKDMLMTIPGIRNINVTVSYHMADTMEIDVFANQEDEINITKQVTDYLDKQLKMKNMKYTINFKD